MKTMKLKRSLVESLLFIVMTFVECFCVQCTFFSYENWDNAQHFRQKKVYFDRMFIAAYSQTCMWRPWPSGHCILLSPDNSSQHFQLPSSANGGCFTQVWLCYISWNIYPWCKRLFVRVRCWPLHARNKTSGLVVQTDDSAIHWINRISMGKTNCVIHWIEVNFFLVT